MRNLMSLITFLVSLSLTSVAVECATIVNACKEITTKSHLLKTYLFCDYDPDVRPEHEKNNATNVKITVFTRFIDFDDSSNIFTLHSYTRLTWTDPFLTWSPKDYNGLIWLDVRSSDIWTPNIKVHNAADANDDQGFPESGCMINNDGFVTCTLSMEYKAHCNSDYTYFPYDLQNCSIELSSWSYSNDEVNLIIKRRDWTDYIPSKEWELVDKTDTLVNKTFKIDETLNTNLYNIQFVLSRRSSALQIIYIAPAIVLIVLTLSVLWLDCCSTERMIIASISFICHLLCIQDLYFTIPHNGGVSPNLLRFYENSFMLVGLSLILTVLLRELHSSKTRAPTWLSSTTLVVLRSKPGQLLLLSILDPKASAFLDSNADDNTDLVQQQQRSDKPTDSTWAYVTLLLGWLAFVSAFFVYAIMLFVLLPSSKENKF